MKLEELSENWFGHKDPTIRHAVAHYNLSEPTFKIVNKAGKVLAQGKTRDEAKTMINSAVLRNKFGPLSAVKE